MRDYFRLYLAQARARKLYAEGQALDDACAIAADEHDVDAGVVFQLADEAIKACADALAERNAKFEQRTKHDQTS